MFDLHPQIITKDGNSEFVVLPYEEFVRLQALLEDAEDILALSDARFEEGAQPTARLEDLKSKFNLA